MTGILACNKETPTKVLSCEYSEVFKNAYFEVETLENEIYSCFFMSEVIHSLLSKVKYTETLFRKRNMVLCKILIQHFPSWKQRSPLSLLDLAGKINSICKPSSKYIDMFSIFVPRKKYYLNLFLTDGLFLYFYVLI